MEKHYVNEIRPDGEISTVGLFYSRGEAEGVVARLRSIPEKSRCRYEITEIVPSFPRTRRSKKTNETRNG
jgi:hypothetical protein